MGEVGPDRRAEGAEVLRRRDGGAWALDTNGDGVVIPTVVQGALQARLDRLSPKTREVVSVASAIGRGFGLPLLERLLPREQVVPALSDLMRLDLIVEVRRRPAPEYRFRHGLVQEVAYNSLLEPARRSLHRRIGEALEQSAYGLMMSEDPAPATQPQRLEAPSEDPGPHLSYAIQWILFAIMGFVFIGYVIRTERRHRREDSEDTSDAAPEPARRRDRDAVDEDALLDAAER